MRSNSGSMGRLSFMLSVWLLLCAMRAQGESLRVLMVGGGPNPDHNQVSIESNIRYLLRLLPDGLKPIVLFADGDATKETVLFEEKPTTLPVGERILALLLDGREAARPTNRKFRPPQLTQLDGPARKAEVRAAFNRLQQEQQQQATPVLLYFTGHGNRSRVGDLDNNLYDLWQDEPLTVRELAACIAPLPPDQPLTLVMVQCYSGSFGNLLFEGGDPQRPVVERDIAGFFSTVRERVAAGCTPEVDEKEYHDFTSYFFAALTGRDRLGRRVTGADYDRDGRVGMHEAFCYTLIHNASIDVPVCTSDIFLRRVVRTPDPEIFQTPYSQVKVWASPAQRAALEALSRSLHLDGEERAQTAYRRFRGDDPSQPRRNPLAAARRDYQRTWQQAREALFARWPDLREPTSSEFAATRKEAQAWAERQSGEGIFKELLEAERALERAEKAAYERELTEARLMRFVRLFKSVVLAHQLREGSDESAKQRFERLLLSEGRSCLPYADLRLHSTKTNLTAARSTNRRAFGSPRMK